jgi:N-acetyl-anhydromuramyl-L-alanine amidase AmpD
VGSVFVAAVALSSCRATKVTPIEPVREMPPPGDEIVVCGERISIGAPVVLWTEFPGYDAYKTSPHFAPGSAEEPARADKAASAEKPASADKLMSADKSTSSDKAPSSDKPVSTDDKTPKGLRYQPGRVRKDADGVQTVLVEPGSRDIARLAEVVDQFVLHYDVCGTSETCFRVLHDQRGLSVHFLLDIDGTIYQTLDVRDQAFHATKANSRAIGIEIANIGAYPVNAKEPWKKTPLDEWYASDAGGPYITIPARLKGGGVRTPGFIGRPARTERVVGTIQGETLQQCDFTREQYESLVKLTAGLCRALPKIAPDAPRDSSGKVKYSVLSAEEFDAFQGIVGHYHVQENKTDPGPALDWEKFLANVRAELVLRTP